MSDPLVCTICSAPGLFLTPAGPMCPTDALLAAIWQTAHEWMPVLIQPDGAPRELGQFPEPVTVPA